MIVQIQIAEGPDRGRAPFEFAERDRFFVGRDERAQLCVLNDPAFSRLHFVLEISPPDIVVQDLNSLNGTYVNNQRVGRQVVRAGDKIRAGNTVLDVDVFEELDSADLLSADESAATPAGDEFDDLLGGAAPRAARVAVRCGRCGERAANEQARPRDEQVVFFCDACRAALRQQPVLLPDYQVLRKLGEGGMKQVYLAVHRRLGVQRALAQVLPRAPMSAKARARFLREARIQASLQHEHIVRLYNLAEVRPGIFCLDLEYVEGQDAESLLEKQHPQGMPVPLAVEIVAQALAGLAFAHAQGIVHRDIKDANFFVARTPDGGVHVKVGDFGLAREYESSGASGITAPNDMAGTVPFMPPEQVVQYRNVKPPADVYAMGSTLYRLLTGCTPLEFPAGRNPFVVIMEDPIVPIRARNPAIPPALAAVVEQALRKDPAERYPSAREMRDALLRAVGRA